MNRARQLTLVNAVLTTVLTYLMTIFYHPKLLVRKIDRIRHNFLWCGEENVSDAKCLVNWKIVCSSKSLGGLRVKYLNLFSRALWLRWAWLDWTDVDRPWRAPQSHLEMRRKSFSRKTNRSMEPPCT
jgi:hypothetical protein